MKKRLNCILIVDDDEPTNFISEMLIEEANCTEHLQIAQTGHAALNYLSMSEGFACQDKSFPCPDLILLDINMPRMNGWEFINEYKDIIKIDKERVILVMLTTSLNPEDNSKAYEMSEISGFENKPLTADKLNRILRTYFAANFQ